MGPIVNFGRKMTNADSRSICNGSSISLDRWHRTQCDKIFSSLGREWCHSKPTRSSFPVVYVNYALVAYCHANACMDLVLKYLDCMHPV